jgi:hypothetical protein
MHTYTNGGAGAAIPPANIPTVIPVVNGAGLAHRRLSKPQLACLAANVHDGTVQFDPSLKQLASLFGVSLPYIMGARKLSPGERDAIMQGYDVLRFADLVRPPRQLSLAMPVIPDIVLENLVRSIGTDRLLAAACAVENNT